MFCWNHLRRDLRHWLSTSTTNATSDDKSEYGNNLVQLMQCESIEAFEDLEVELKLKWSNPMIEYFDTPPSEHLRPTSGTPFERRFYGRSMVILFSLLTAYRTWWCWAVYICPFSVIVVN